MSTNQSVPVNQQVIPVWGAPEGRDFASCGTIEVDLNTGCIYIKVSPSDTNTGWNQFVTTGTNSTGQIGFANFTELRAKKTHVANEVALMLGAASPGDGFVGQFYYNPTDTRADDADDFGGTIVKPDNIAAASAGRWNKYF